MNVKRNYLFFILAVLIISAVFLCIQSSENFARADENFSGSGTEDAPYLIENADDLSLLAYLTNNAIVDENGKLYSTKNYKLTADIDLTGKEITIGDSNSYIELGYVNITDFLALDNDLHREWVYFKNNFYENDGENYFVTDDEVYSISSIYYYDVQESDELIQRAFFGNFDGNGKSISNGTQVLFDCVRNATVSNLRLTNFDVSDSSLLVNSAINSQIADCVVDNGKLDGTNDVGALVGALYRESGYLLSLPYMGDGHEVIVSNNVFEQYLNQAQTALIKTSSSIDNVISGNDNVGGVVGYCSSDTLVEDCFNSSSIAVDENGMGGGLCGSSNGTLRNLLGVFSSENVPAIVDYYPSLANSSTLYYPIDFCSDYLSTASYRAVELLSETFASTYLSDWTLASDLGNKLFYPAPNSLYSYGEEFYSVTMDGQLVDYVRVSAPTYEIPLPSKGIGYCYESENNAYLQGDIASLDGDLALTTILVAPGVNLGYSTSITYNGLAQTVATANYTHALELTATYQWYYQNGEEFLSKSSGENLSLTNVNESGYYKCVLTVSDGILSSSVESETIFIQINKKALSARSYVDVGSSVYDGNGHLLTYQYQYEGLVDGDELLPTPTVGDLINVGEYQLTFVIDDDNYDIVYEYGTYTIFNADISYEINSYSGIYDGIAHGIIIESITTVDGCPYVISYSTNNIDYADSVTLTNVGSLSVYVKISAPNHNEIVVSRNINISKCTVTIALNKSEYPDITKVYDGTYSCDVNLIKYEHVKLSYDSDYVGVSPVVVNNASFVRSTVIAKTSVTVNFALSDTKNFILGTQSLVFGGCSITPAEIKIIPNESLPTLTKRYDGTLTYPINQLPNDLYTVVTDCPVAPIVSINTALFNSANVTEANSVRISFVVTTSCYYFADGYDDIQLDAGITPKTVTVENISVLNRTYDGTKVVTVSDYQLSGVIDGDSVALNYTSALSENENASETPHLVTISGLAINNSNYALDYSESYAYVTISKAEPTVNPIVENTPVYLSSAALPNISLSVGDTEGVIEWAPYEITESGEITYQWNFSPSSTNYNEKVGSVLIVVNDVIPTSIRAESHLDVNEYVALSKFVIGTIDVILIYNDGSTSLVSYKTDIRDGYTIEYQTDAKCIVFGDTYVTVNYGEFSDTVEIVVSKITLTKPTVYGSYVYNGNTQTLAMSNFDVSLMIADGNKKITAGESEVTISLRDSNNYCFEDGSASFVYLWTIAPKAVSEPYLLDGSSEYDGMEKSIEVVNPTQKTYYTVSGNLTALNQGEYPITVSLIDKTNYVWHSTSSNEDIVLTYVITSKVIEKPLIYNLPYVYDGNENSAQTDANNAYTLSGDTTYVNAGSYTINAVLNNVYNGEELLHKNYVWEDGTHDMVTLTYQVNKITVNVPNINTRFEYNGKTHRIPLENNFNYTVSGNLAEVNAGSYQVVLTLSDSINFVWADGTTEDKVIQYRILKKTIQIPSVLGTSVYSGYEMTALIPLSQYYTLIGNTATAVGKHTAKASLNNKLNYQWSDGTTNDITLIFEIVKRVIDIPDAPESLWYNGFPQVAHIVSDEAYVISGNSATEPGTYTATISLKDKKNYLWKDGSNDDVKYTYYIYSISFSEESTPILNGSFNSLSELYIPEKEGFTFAGWYDNPNYEGEKITAITNPKPNLILYAKWELVEYKEPIYTEENKKGGLGTNAILGIAIAGGALVIALLIIGIGFVLKRR